MYARMRPRNRRRAIWLYNQEVEPQFFKMGITIGTGGVPVFMPAGGISQSPFHMLFGCPMFPFESCEALGTEGDIMYVDFSEYLLSDRGDIKTAASIHARFVYDETALRFTYRVDGLPRRQSALTPYKGTKELSPFITLADRT